MAAPIAILGSLIGKGSQGGGGSYKNAPGVSPGLDPGRYAFELRFNRKRREEDQANMDRDFYERKRQFDVASGMQDRDQDMQAIGQLAQMRQNALGNARGRIFRNKLLNSL
jgi:hypothetical protein